MPAALMLEPTFKGKAVPEQRGERPKRSKAAAAWHASGYNMGLGLDAVASFAYPAAMPQTEIAKKHHYIPEFYLKRWASGRKIVEFIRHYQGVVKPRRRYPSETGYTRMGYALRGFPPDAASALEELYFKPVDTRASEALAKMETGSTQITRAERVAWAQFVLSLVHRQPERIESMRQRYEALTLRVSKAEQRRWRRERTMDDPTSLVDAIRAEWARNEDKLQRQSLELMTNAISSNLINNHLMSMRWGTITLPPNVPALLTSDRPVQWYLPMVHDQCHILLPIGPKSVFWAVNKPEMAFILQSRLPMQLVDFMNEHTVRRAVNCVYGISEVHLAYVQERMGVDPMPDQGDAGYADPTPKRLNPMRRQAAKVQRTARRERG